MKVIHYVPPLVVLTIAAAWLASLRASNSALERTNLSLRGKISESRSSSPSQNEAARGKTKIARAKSGERPSEDQPRPSADWVSVSRDWKELVLFNNNESEYRFKYTAAWARLEKLALEMTGDELARASTEMTALPVQAPFRRELNCLMMNELAKKNPEFAFSHYIEIYQSEEKPPPMGGFDEWLARDPAAASTWYVGQLTAGVFDKSLDGKSPAKLLFEAAFIKSLSHPIQLISPAEAAMWKRGASNAGYHCFGCAKTFALMGKAFAEANLSMMK